MKAIGESTGRSLAQVKTEYKKIGDLGMIAQVCDVILSLLDPIK